MKKVGAASGGQAALTRRVVYKTVEIVDGQAVPSYSSRKPATGSFEVVVH